MFKILSGKSTEALEEEAEKYNIKELGTLVISNGHYFLAIIGDLKETKVTNNKRPVETKGPTAKPKPKPKTEPKSKPTPSKKPTKRKPRASAGKS